MSDAVLAGLSDAERRAVRRAVRRMEEYEAWLLSPVPHGSGQPYHGRIASAALDRVAATEIRWCELAGIAIDVHCQRRGEAARKRLRRMRRQWPGS